MQYSNPLDGWLNRNFKEADPVFSWFQWSIIGCCSLSRCTSEQEIYGGEEIFVIGSNEFGQKSVESRNFFYFIVEDEDVYGVLMNTRLLIKTKLYEIEELLEHKDFIRISKYCLVNIGKIDYIKPALNSKLDLLLKNSEHLEVNRGYLKDFKKALEI